MKKHRASSGPDPEVVKESFQGRNFEKGKITAERLEKFLEKMAKLLPEGSRNSEQMGRISMGLVTRILQGTCGRFLRPLRGQRR